MNHFMKLNLSLKLFCITKRSLHISFSNHGRPPHQRSAFRKTRIFPFFKTYYDNDGSGPLEVVIDEIKTYPPGNWGSMTIKDAWKRYKEGKHLRTLPTYFDKLQSMSWTEYNTWYHTLQLPLQFPETLDFSQFITRTKIYEDIPDSIKDSFNSISSEEIGRTSVMLKLHLDNYLNQASQFLPSHDIAERNRQSNEFICQIMDNITRSMHNQSLFENYSTSPNSIIETFIKRASYDELEAPEIVKDKEGCVKYRIRGNLAWHLRSRDLLKQFVSVDDMAAPTNDVLFPKYNYDPKIFDLEPSECESFTNLPFTYSANISEYARNIPGFWGSNPFKVGDTCGFGVLGVVNTDLSRSLNNQYRLDHPEVVDRHHMSEAILAGFTWTLSQAQNQGFSIYDELAFPFCSCILLTDGRQMQMAYYQLNSISSLWKPEDAHFPPNMMWISPKINLFDLDETGTSVTTVHEHAVHQLLAAFSLPKSDLASSETQPHLLGPAPRDLPALTIDFDPSTATEKELETYRDRSRVVQLFKMGRGHPNRAFYFEEVRKEELDEELRQTVPGIDRVPSSVAREICAVRTRREIHRRGKKRVQREPTEWR